MALEITIAIVAVALLIAVAAASARDGSIFTFRQRPPQTPVVSRGAVLLFFISAFGGISVATGAAPGNAVALFGSLVGCMVARAILTGARPKAFGRASVWATVLSWSALSGLAAHRTMLPRQALDAQAVLGPLVTSSDIGRSIPSIGAFLAGLVAAAWWCRCQSGPSDDAMAKVMRAFEAASAATIVTSMLWGPSLVVLIRGPLTAGTVAWSASSFGVNILAVIAVVFARDKMLGQERMWLWPATVVVLSAFAASLLGAWV